VGELPRRKVQLARVDILSDTFSFSEDHLSAGYGMEEWVSGSTCERPATEQGANFMRVVSETLCESPAFDS